MHCAVVTGWNGQVQKGGTRGLGRWVRVGTTPRTTRLVGTASDGAQSVSCNFSTRFTALYDMRKLVSSDVIKASTLEQHGGCAGPARPGLHARSHERGGFSVAVGRAERVGGARHDLLVIAPTAAAAEGRVRVVAAAGRCRMRAQTAPLEGRAAGVRPVVDRQLDGPAQRTLVTLCQMRSPHSSASAVGTSQRSQAQHPPLMRSALARSRKARRARTEAAEGAHCGWGCASGAGAVSYTHLTLPTKRIV